MHVVGVSVAFSWFTHVAPPSDVAYTRAWRPTARLPSAKPIMVAE